MSHFCTYVFHDRDTNVDELLAKYQEGLRMDPPVLAYTKKDAIKSVRDWIEEYRNSSFWKEYTSDPEKYRAKNPSAGHLKFLEEDFPKMLNFTDEECYEYKKSDWEDEAGLIKENGDLYTTYNPNSKWDWYQVGGRWFGNLPDGMNEMTVGDIKEPEKVDVPFAFVKPDGEWVEKGEMGWFCAVGNETSQDEWNKVFLDYIKTLPADTVVTVVDCHI